MFNKVRRAIQMRRISKAAFNFKLAVSQTSYWTESIKKRALAVLWFADMPCELLRYALDQPSLIRDCLDKVKGDQSQVLFEAVSASCGAILLSSARTNSKLKRGQAEICVTQARGLYVQKRLPNISLIDATLDKADPRTWFTNVIWPNVFAMTNAGEYFISRFTQATALDNFHMAMLNTRSMILCAEMLDRVVIGMDLLDDFSTSA